MKLAAPVNEGWLYNKDRYAIKLFCFLTIGDDDGFFDVWGSDDDSFGLCEEDSEALGASITSPSITFAFNRGS